MLVGQYDDCLEALVNKTKLKPKLNQTALDIWRLVGSREPQGVITRSHKDQINTVNIYHFLFPFPFCHKNPPTHQPSYLLPADLKQMGSPLCPVVLHKVPS